MRTKIIIEYFKRCDAKGIDPTVHGLYEFKRLYELKEKAEATTLEGSTTVVDTNVHAFNQYISFCKDFNLQPVEAFGTAVKMYEIQDYKRVI